jgi:hypothetical protein
MNVVLESCFGRDFNPSFKTHPLHSERSRTFHIYTPVTRSLTMSTSTNLLLESGTPAGEQPPALAILQTVQNHQFNSLAEASTYLQSLGPEDRFEVVNSQASKLVDVQDVVDKYMEYLENFVAGDSAFRDRMQRDPEVWQKVSEGASRARTSEKKKQQAVEKCFKKWGEGNVRHHFGHFLDAGENTWSKIRRLAMEEPDVQVAVGRVRDAAYWRLTHSRPGRSSDPYPVTADLGKARDRSLPAASSTAIARVGCAVDSRGWLVRAGQRLSVQAAIEEDDSPLSSPPSDLEGFAIEGLEGAGIEGGGGDGGALPNRKPGLRLGQGNLPEHASPSADTSEAGDHPPAWALTDDSAADEYAADGEEEEDGGESVASDGGTTEEGRPAKRRKLGPGPPRTHKCHCAGAVPSAFIARCSTKKVLPPARQVQLVKDWMLHEGGGGSVCFQHTKNVASAVGMQTRNLNTTTARERLRRYHQAILENAIGDLKAAQETYSWFRMADRPSRPSDRLGPYKLMPKATRAFTIDADDQARLCTYLGIGREAWDRDGSVVVDCFDWWATEKYTGTRVALAGRTILEVVLEEFDLYHAHLRLINNKANLGWLRNMYHSLGQQAMRQDPKYFAIYCALRPDRNTNLVSYPYYAKYTHEGDNTFFRHIDVNIGQLAGSGRGASMIQGTVSLDNESKDDCTEILPGMHRHIQEWHGVLAERGLSSAALVHRVEGNMFTSEDEKRFGTQWTSQPCQSGQVRVTLPHLPHGACGPAKGVRRTMLPWFCGLQNDLETLEVVEGGTWSELSVAHRDMVAARFSPSGLANRYGAIPFAFPAAVRLKGLGDLSDALVCQERHNKSTVMLEKRLLLTGAKADVDAYLDRWRKEAVNRVCEAFELVKETEMEEFGEKSYFYRKANGLPPAVADGDPDPVDDARGHGFEEEEEEEEGNAGALGEGSMEIEAGGL